MTSVLGKISYLEKPDVNGDEVIITEGGVHSLSLDTNANRPPAGTSGRLFVDITNNKISRDTGSAWEDLSSSADILGTANQILVTGPAPDLILSLASNPIIPGLQRMKLPTGATADRPAVPASGDTRFNSTLNKAEYFNGTDWLQCGNTVQFVYGTVTSISGTATIPMDTTIPQITEGFQILSTSFTPQATSSKIIFETNLMVSNSSSGRYLILPLFVNGVANAVSVNAVYSTTANTAWNIKLRYIYNSVSKAPVTFALRLGANHIGTTYVGRAGANTLGGIINNFFTITEIL